MAAGRCADVLEVVRLVLAANPGDAQLLLLEGRAYAHEGFLENAQMSFIRASRAAPRDVAPLLALGDVLMKRGDPSRAEKVLERAKQLAPASREAAQMLERARRLARLASAQFDESAEDELEEEPTQMRSMNDLSRNPVNNLVSGERPIDRSRYENDSWEDPDTAISPGPEAEALRESLERQHAAAAAAPQAVAPAPAPRTNGTSSAQQRAVQVKSLGSTVGYDEGRRPLPEPTEPTLPTDRRPADSRRPAPVPMAGGSLGETNEEATEARGITFDPELAKGSSPSPARDVLDSRPPAQAKRAPVPAQPAPEPEPADTTPSIEPPPGGEDAPAFVTARGFTPPPIPAADLMIGQEAGAPEDIDRNLAVLEELGIFEPPHAEPKAAPGTVEVERAGTRMGLVLAAAWVLALGLAGGGYYGWQQWIAHRHAEASRMVEWARGETRAGEHRGLVGAERQLLAARELDPHRGEIMTALIFVHAQRSFEDGAFEPGYLRRTIARARTVDAAPVAVAAAEAVLLAADGDAQAGLTKMRAAVQTAPNHPMVLYLAGRFEQRLGDQSAIAHIETAHQRDPSLVAATLALAEARYAAGQRDQALALVDEVLRAHPDHLRATLYKGLWTSDTVEPAAGLAALDGLGERLEHGAPVDQVLVQITKARLLRRQGAREPAGAAVEAAYQVGVTEPRVLALIANEALQSGKLEIARQAGTRSAAGAPTNLAFRKMFAEVLISMRDGESAQQTLRTAPDDDPEVALLRSRAALVAHDRAVMDVLAPGLDALAPTSPVAAALKVRFDVARGNASGALDAARQLVTASPDVIDVQVALADAALAQNDAASAITALQTALRLDPSQPEASFLLARARRVLGDADGAEQALRQAIAVLPDYADAQLALGNLLLERGRYVDADAIFTRLSRRVGNADGMTAALAGRLGRIEALLGQGLLDEARVQAEAVQGGDRDSDRARITLAKLHIVAGEGTAASEILRPMTEAQGADPVTFALLGDAYAVIGHRDDAAEAYETALERDEDMPHALVGRAMIAVEEGQEGTALELVERARVALSERVAPPALRARMLIALGRANTRDDAAAKDALLRATQVEGAPPEAFFWLGEALRGDRDSAGATAAYRRYLELAPEGPFAARARRATR